MNRREFIAIASGATLWSPISALAQSAKTYRVGHAWVADPASVRPYEEAFLSVLRDRGYVVGRNLVYDTRYANGDPTRVPVLVDELIALKPDVLTGIEQVAKVMASKTSTIPIVLVSASDPVAAGLVKSLSHPGGNVTGVSQQSGELGPKRIELMREVLPGLARVGQLHDINVPASKAAEAEARQAAEKLGIAYVPYYVANRSDLDRVFAEMEKSRPDALVTGAGSGLLYGLRQLIIDNLLRLRIPSCLAVSVQAKLGALMSYGPDLPEGNRLAATYVDRILKGAKPSELPIEQPTKFELVINLKTAKVFGLTIPPGLLARADEVIE